MNPDTRDKLTQRVRRLIDPVASEKDAFYAAQVSILRNFLAVFEMAMEDEDIDERTIERVLNRVVYATPSGADAYERIERDDREYKRLMGMP